MKNQAFRTLLKIWIGLASMLAFLFGWVTFAHSGKPVSASGGSAANPPAQIAPLPTLEPLPPLGSSRQVQPLQQIPQQSFNFIPRMRTRGS